MADLMIDTSVNQFCKIWPSANWPLLVHTVQSDLMCTVQFLLYMGLGKPGQHQCQRKWIDWINFAVDSCFNR